jgi:hypothetical protein
MEGKGKRIRKMLVTMLSVLALCAVHWFGKEVNWALMGGIVVLDLGFVSADTLDKAFQSGALGLKK